MSYTQFEWFLLISLALGAISMLFVIRIANKRGWAGTDKHLLIMFAIYLASALGPFIVYSFWNDGKPFGIESEDKTEQIHQDSLDDQ